MVARKDFSKVCPCNWGKPAQCDDKGEEINYHAGQGQSMCVENVWNWSINRIGHRFIGTVALTPRTLKMEISIA